MLRKYIYNIVSTECASGNMEAGALKRIHGSFKNIQ